MKKIKTYKVSLSRAYIVTIKAKDRQKARRYAEFYIGDCPDISILSDINIYTNQD